MAFGMVNSGTRVKHVADRENFVYDGNVFFKIMKLFGCFSVIKHGGRLQFQWFCWTTVYTVLYNLMWSGYCVWTGYNLIGNFARGEFSFEQSVMYGAFCSIPVMEVMPILTFWEARTLASYLDAWADFQEVFQRITTKKLRMKYPNYHLLCLLFGPLVITLAVANWSTNFETMISQHQLDYTTHTIMIKVVNYMSIIMAIYGFLWFLLTRTIGYVAEALIQDIESLRWTENRMIRNHIILWFNLRQQCLRLGSALPWTYCYSTSICFCVSIPMLYIGSIHAQQGNYATLLGPFNCLIFISALAEMAHQAVEKVSAEFETRITALIAKVNDTECENELLTFLEKIATHPVVVYLGGFFPLNRSINPAMYSSVITYLIIIIQFRGEAPNISLNQIDSTSADSTTQS